MAAQSEAAEHPSLPSSDHEKRLLFRSTTTWGSVRGLTPPTPLDSAAPVSQATHYYREGRYTSCSDCWKDFKTSIAAKMCNEEQDARVSSPLQQADRKQRG